MVCMTKLLEEYKKMPKNIQDNLHILDSYHTCYLRDENMSDDMVEFVTNRAKDCWIADDYCHAGVTNYTDYLLDAIYEYDATKEELDELYTADIVEAFNSDDSAEELVTFDTTNYEYCFSTIDRLNYYADDDGLYIVNDNDRCIKKPNPMENPLDEIFSLLKENKIVYMPLSMHYNIRCMIKNDILGDEELEERYKLGIENYKKYCVDRFITSEDILYKCGEDTDISLTDIDGKYTQTNMMERLSKYYNNIHKDGSRYSYVASLDNGIDYYYKKGKYLALDKNNVVKEFDETNNFLFKELNKKHKFIHIEPEERLKMAREINQEYKNLTGGNIQSAFLINRPLYEINTFFNHEMTKELDSFKGSEQNTLLTMKLALSEYERQDKSERIKQTLNNRKKDDVHEI